MIRLNTFQFAGAPLSIAIWGGSVEPISENGIQLAERITTMLSRRYNAEHKLLDLSALGSDPDFAFSGMFDTHTRQTKFFLAIMQVCENMFTSTEQKREAVVSVTLANNGLPNVTPVTTLSQTFPDIKNLDLSNNNLKDLSAIEAWRRKFRFLDHLVLTGNPIEIEVPTYREEIVKWFPKLRTLNGTQIRSDEEAAATTKNLLPIPVLPASFQDEASIGETFVKHFFPAYDTDRAALASAYYDAESSFSLSVNVSAPRSTSTPAMKNPTWESYIKKSRNLTKITSLPARMARIAKGADHIRETWLTLPSTKHPDFLAQHEKWCIECYSLPGLPDPSKQSASGVGGLIVMVHGEFDEIDVSTGSTDIKRSFDRTFVLGPGGGVGGVRVINDVLVLRAYGGFEAWRPDGLPRQPQVPDNFGSLGPGKTDEQVQKELMALELSRLTRMTLQYSGLCLEQSAWDLMEAARAFEQAKVRASSVSISPESVANLGQGEFTTGCLLLRL